MYLVQVIDFTDCISEEFCADSMEEAIAYAKSVRIYPYVRNTFIFKLVGEMKHDYGAVDDEIVPSWLLD